MKTQKKQRNLGKMLGISPYKALIAKGILPPHLAPHKHAKIIAQVQKRLQAIDAVKHYQPFTSRSPRRKPRQVGA